jgi:16S rRNA processing protein RimM
MPVSTERIVLGEVTGAHGLQGEVRVRVGGDTADHLLTVETVWLGSRPGDPEARRHVVTEVGLARSGEVRLRLQGIDHRDKVQPLLGMLVTAPPTILPDLPEGEFYWYELIGCRVESETGLRVGTVREVWETGAHDVLMVEDEDGIRRLVPTAAELMHSIDLEARLIIVVDLPGLLEPI